MWSSFIVSVLSVVYFFGSMFIHTNSLKKVHFIRKTGETYNMTETTQSELKNVTYIMHVSGQSVGMDDANL